MVCRLWPFLRGSPPLPPSPRPMYKNPSGPKTNCPPLWLGKGWTTVNRIRSVVASARFGLIAEAWDNRSQGKRQRRRGCRAAATQEDQASRSQDHDEQKRDGPCRHALPLVSELDETAGNRRILLSSLLFLLHPHHRDFGKAFLEGGWAQLGGHALHHVFGNHAVAALVAVHADFYRDVKEDGVDLVAVIARHLDPGVPLVGGEIGSVNIVQGTAGDQTRFQHRAKIGEHQVLKT